MNALTPRRESAIALAIEIYRHATTRRAQLHALAILALVRQAFAEGIAHGRQQRGAT